MYISEQLCIGKVAHLACEKFVVIEEMIFLVGKQGDSDTTRERIEIESNKDKREVYKGIDF